MFLTSAILFAGCSKSSTSVVAPSAAKCSVSATSTPGSFSASGGSGTVSVSAARDCTWSVSADASWIAVQGPASGQGDATVGYAVQANPVPAARSGSIVVSNERLAVSQAGAPCRFALSSGSDSIDVNGGRLSVGVTTLAGCGWTASSGASWIAIQSGQSGNGSGTVVLAVSPNDGGERVGSVNVAGQNYTVTQPAKPAAPSPSPAPGPSPTPPPSPSPSPAPAPVVNFNGSVSNLSGACPSVSFQINGQLIQTSAATSYQHGECSALKKGVRITGSGVAQPDGTVLATAIVFKD